MPSTTGTGPDSRRRPVWVGVGVVVAVLALPFVGPPLAASWRYRSAIGDLHRELTAVDIDSAAVVDERIDRCWNDVAPASIRVLEPVDGASTLDVVEDYVDALRPLGFYAGTVGTEQVTSRERNDDLDGDIIRLVVAPHDGTVTVVATAYDVDLVRCLPF